MRLRDYQQAALDGARDAFRRGERACLIELPTGTGKTVVFAEASRLACAKGGKVLVLAHRTELLAQAKAKLLAVAPDLRVEIEQAAARATVGADVVVASVQSLKGKRLERWAADAFALVIIDEAHHATAKSYRTILDHFATARVLGVTATPDRADGTKLGAVFPALAFQLPMQRAIDDGYLVPIRLRTVRVDALSLAHVATRKGDFVERDLVAALEGDEVLLEIAGPLPELAGDRPTIVFVAGVKNAHRLAELLNDPRIGRPGCAVALDGTTEAGIRSVTLRRFKRGAFQFLINVGLFTEGFDCPPVACVAVARPTQSRALYCQMIGRGTRPLDGALDGCSDAASRVAAIGTSPKPDLLVVDFTPSTSQHRLITPLDVLGVESPEVADRALELLEADPDLDVTEAAALATEEVLARVKHRLADTYELTVEAWDPFRLIEGDLDFSGALDVDLAAARDGVEPPGVRDRLAKAGVAKAVVKRLTPGQCVAVLRAVEARRERGLCSLKAAAQLRRFGLNPNVDREAAGYAMMHLQRVGWSHVPSALLNDPRFRTGVAA